MSRIRIELKRRMVRSAGPAPKNNLRRDKIFHYLIKSIDSISLSMSASVKPAGMLNSMLSIFSRWFKGKLTISVFEYSISSQPPLYSQKHNVLNNNALPPAGISLVKIFSTLYELPLVSLT